MDGILKRLKTDYLDVLLLHRPDALMEPEEVAEAFDLLESSGKVRYFGVSNHNPMQIQLLKKSVKQPIVANQLQLSIAHATMISSGINVNMENDAAITGTAACWIFAVCTILPFNHGRPYSTVSLKACFSAATNFPN